MPLTYRTSGAAVRAIEPDADGVRRSIVTTGRPGVGGTVGVLNVGIVGDLLLLLYALIRRDGAKDVWVGTSSRLVLFHSSSRFVTGYREVLELPIRGSITHLDMVGDPYFVVDGTKHYFELARYKDAQALYELSTGSTPAPQGNKR